jgi:hypothetical protein
MAKTHGVGTPVRTTVPPRPPTKKKSTFVGSTSNQPTTDQSSDDKKKGATDKEVPMDPNDTDKKLHLNIELDTK